MISEMLINGDFCSLARPDAFFRPEDIEKISRLKKREQRRQGTKRPLTSVSLTEPKP